MDWQLVASYFTVKYTDIFYSVEKLGNQRKMFATRVSTCESRYYLINWVSLDKLGFSLKLVLPRDNPAGMWCQNDVAPMSMRHHHVALTFIRHHFTSFAGRETTFV